MALLHAMMCVGAKLRSLYGTEYSEQHEGLVKQFRDRKRVDVVCSEPTLKASAAAMDDVLQRIDEDRLLLTLITGHDVLYASDTLDTANSGKIGIVSPPFSGPAQSLNALTLSDAMLPGDGVSIVDNIAGAVLVDGEAGNDSLTVLDSGDPSGDTVLINETTIQGMTSFVGPIDVSYLAIEQLDVTTSSSKDLVTIDFTTGGSDLVNAVISGAGGDDTINVRDDANLGEPVVGGNASSVNDATTDAALRAILADWVTNNPAVPAGLGTLQLDGVQDLLIGDQGADAFHQSALPELTDEDRVYDFLAMDGDSLLP